MRILITGSRHFTNYDTVMRGLSVAIETLVSRNPEATEIVVVHGAARGADEMAGNFVRHARAFLKGQGITLTEERHPVTQADWNTLGKSAGVVRNQKMVDLGADICVAFFKAGEPNKGTTHCSNAARKAGIEVLEYTA